MKRVPRIVVPSLAMPTGCLMCSRSCQGWEVRVEAEEKRAIESALEASGEAIPEAAGFHADEDGSFHLRKQRGRCGFLEEGGACFLHRQFGPAGKPLVCQAFPWLVFRTPGAEYWTVSLACSDTLTRLSSEIAELEPASQPAAAGVEHDFTQLERPSISLRERGPWRRWEAVRARVLEAVRNEADLATGLREARTRVGARRARQIAGRQLLRDCLELRAAGPGLSRSERTLCRSLAPRALKLGPLRASDPESAALRHFVWLRLFVSTTAVEQGWASALTLAAIYAGLARLFALELGLNEGVFCVEKWFVHAPAQRSWRESLENWQPGSLLR